MFVVVGIVVEIVFVEIEVVVAVVVGIVVVIGIVEIEVVDIVVVVDPFD